MERYPMALESIINELKQIDESLTNNGLQIYERNIRFGFASELSLLGLFVPFIICKNQKAKKEAIHLLKKHIDFADEKILDIETVKNIETLQNSTIKENYLKNPQKIYEIIFTKITSIEVALALMSTKVNEFANQEYNPDKTIFLNFVENAYSQISQIFGIWNYTNLFDDFVITHKYPKEYKEVLEITKAHLTRSRDEIYEIINTLKKHQKHHNEIFKGRIKSPASVFKKIYVRKEKAEDILDFVAIRIITNTISDCYSWLGLLYELYPPRLSKFKDYIQHPKPNGYKSLHVICDTKYGPVEFQMRTHSMHKFAEFGIAAHWKYKTKSNNRILEKIKFALGSQDPNFGQGFIFVFTPKKDVILLQRGATIVDFAYSIHTHLGDQLSHAEVNNQQENLDYQLKDYDNVKVFTDPKKKPSRKWLEFVATSKARNEIAQNLRITRLDTRTKVTNPTLLLKERVQVAQCCNPFCDDEVGIYKSTKRKLILHKISCLDKTNTKYSLASETLKNQFLKSKELRIIFATKPSSLIEHFRTKYNMQDIELNDKTNTLIFKTSLQNKDEFDHLKDQLKEEEFVESVELI
jgi:(p)ppGpp synthase/HD superfamily hydrolase